MDGRRHKKFVEKTDCVVNEYGNFTAVDDVKVNGKLTLGENTADNGGLVLAYMAYMERAKKERGRSCSEEGRLHCATTLLYRICAELVRKLEP